MFSYFEKVGSKQYGNENNLIYLRISKSAKIVDINDIDD